MMRIFAALIFITLIAPNSVFAEDVKAGKKVFKKCKSCHTVKPEKHKVGPSLYKIIDRAAGASEGYNYSAALKSSGVTWDVDTLTAFLKKPKDVIPDNKMSFSGLKKDEDIASLLAYIKSKS